MASTYLDIEAVVAEGQSDDRDEALGGDGAFIDEGKTFVVVGDACRVRRIDIQPYAHQQRKKYVFSHLDIGRSKATRLAQRLTKRVLFRSVSLGKRTLFRLVSRLDHLVEGLDKMIACDARIKVAHGRTRQRKREKRQSS